ncbi:hypothetical protein RRG08_000006 [Elysia crispata]|uniref:Uncharacterized protein n=1 Tax=Elysia crispata TaxID=231223 RepID=A0AAE0Y6B4_9GAST|nr:hypothetical protein RRG08_000006 [Elysia crispata]
MHCFTQSFKEHSACQVHQGSSELKSQYCRQIQFRHPKQVKQNFRFVRSKSKHCPDSVTFSAEHLFRYRCFWLR